MSDRARVIIGGLVLLLLLGVVGRMEANDHCFEHAVACQP